MSKVLINLRSAKRLHTTFGGLVKGGVLESFTFIGVEWPTLHQPAVSGRAVFLLPPLYPAA
jgi:hypothetical protein